MPKAVQIRPRLSCRTLRVPASLKRHRWPPRPAAQEQAPPFTRTLLPAQRCTAQHRTASRTEHAWSQPRPITDRAALQVNACEGGSWNETLHELCSQVYGNDTLEDAEWRDAGTLDEWDLVSGPIGSTWVFVWLDCPRKKR